MRNQSIYRILWVMTERFSGLSCCPHCPSVGHTVLSGGLGVPRGSAGPRAGINRLSKGVGPCYWCWDGILVALSTEAGAGRAHAGPQGTELGKAHPGVHLFMSSILPGQPLVLSHAATLVTLFLMTKDMAFFTCSVSPAPRSLPLGPASPPSYVPVMF